MTYKPEKHHRRSIRLKGYNYSQAGLYFITLCCQNRSCIFGEIANGGMILNLAGRIVKEEWDKTIEIRKNIALHEYIIMPNHFHAIIEILYPAALEGELKFAPTGFKSPSQTIGAIIRGFKGATTKRIKEFYFNNRSTGELKFARTTGIAPTGIAESDKIWQRDYYEHIIRNEQSYLRISKYIKNNPANWNIDRLK